ncbi:hypothetical protein HPG02_09950 [Pediococcus pentosaceus]|uniref:hypothetical protein n=1 Tax=Pediococcus pentosaceus TaxID=1255 RepID=UPI00132F72E2|nr:hypothetical protein [Pediococcus pentosaceus]KAF0422783.1 hypothetical protein GBO84_05550 [Pediococcus pentosaceus]MBU7003897.1 hypothetical protein [Pediococcus pentosaceus]MCG9226414.1 hypothetical protein [Pediococcus pentosaceus]MDA8037008.1 hypothetical protein [Pediococcus pentosaceus]
MKEVIVLNTVQNRKLIDEQLISTLPLLRLKQKQSIIRFNVPLTIGDRWYGTLKGVDRQGNTVEYDCEATVWGC